MTSMSSPYIAALSGTISSGFIALTALAIGVFALIWAGRAPQGKWLVRTAGLLLILVSLFQFLWAVCFLLATYPPPVFTPWMVDLLPAVTLVRSSVSAIALTAAVALGLTAVVRGNGTAPGTPTAAR
ncbi:hypothetical protein ACFOVU_29055 [Nocardiopsis sediminis]|uniref:Uncharacterized protein n=1 Tax=Nocardiopsis sediminis TaxID=1778267 RepID=A0ABV8FUZ0_9ACTN